MSEEIKIETGIPIPPGALTGRRRVYPFADMKIGDSFFTSKDYRTVLPSASSFGKHHKLKFVSRKVEGGVRVWRIA